VSHGQFYLEPKNRDIDLDYVDEDSFSVQHFTAFPEQVAFFTPHDVYGCDVVAELGSSPPPLDEAELTVSVPLNVESSEGLYLRTVDEDGDFYRLDVPPGEYDVVARFYPPEDKPVGDSRARYPHCKVALTFLPKGTMGPRVLKVKHGELPERVALRRNDGSVVFVPNGPSPGH
jgi:hypothetical protein